MNKICPITNLVIDKQTDNVAYNDSVHRYWILETGEFYTSVTTFLKKFQKPFDSKLISEAKIIKDNYPHYYSNIKALQGEHLVNTFKTLYLTDEESLNLFESQAKSLRDEWELNNKNAANYGTSIHKAKELNLLESKVFTLFNEKDNTYINYPVKESVINETSCYPELLVYSHKYKIAGQMDLLCIYKSESKTVFNIYDYKTNKSIDKINKYNKKLLKPFDNIDDCNFNIYSFQLSLYAILLKEMFEFLTHLQDLTLIHCPANGKESYIDCQDFRDLLFNNLLRDLL